MQFQYRVRDAQGRLQTGVLGAENRDHVIDRLLSQGYYIVGLEEKRERRRVQELPFLQPRVTLRELGMISRQLSAMLGAGLALLRCLDILQAQTSNKTMIRVLEQVKEDIKAGAAFWEALAAHPLVFPPVFISMIRAGEVGGVLDTVLGRLSEHLEREYEMEARIKSASAYPVIVAIVALVVVFFILSFIMPTFVGMFQAAEVDLPGATRALLAASLFLRSRYGLILILMLVLYLVFRQIGRMPAGRYCYDYLKLHMPVVGPSISRIIAARFTRTMGTLVGSGIPILQALEVSRGVVNNAVVSRAIARTRHSIREGDSIAAPLEATGVFDPMVSQMIAVGEEAGALDDMLIRMSDFYEREVMYSVEAMMSVIEPLLILLLALLVGGIVVATLLPVLDLMNTIGI